MGDKRCGTCVHWNARLNSRGARIVAHDPAHACKSPIPDLPVLPVSVDRSVHGLRWPPTRNFMTKAEGEGCPMWEDWKADRLRQPKGE